MRTGNFDTGDDDCLQMKADIMCQFVMDGYKSGDIPHKDMPTVTLYSTVVLEGLCDGIDRSVY